MSRLITISDLRYRGTFEKVIRESDGRGGWKQTSEPVMTRWMALQAMTKPIDHDKVKAQQQQSSMTYLVTIRYRGDISADMRIAVDGKMLYIIKQPYDPEKGRRRWLTMECEERRE